VNEIDRIRSLITGLQKTQPKIYEALSAVAKALDKLDTNIEAVVSELASVPESGLAIAPNVIVFTYRFTRRNVILEWEQPDLSIFHYEIKVGGADWDTATHVLTTSTLSAVLDPLVVGTTRYWIKGIDFDGNVSIAALALDVVVPAIGAISVTSAVIDNNILFSWTEPTSTFDIDYYTIYKGAVLVGKTKGTFAVVFESVGGTFEYKFKPVDIAGNVGPESTISVEVRQPPDFDLLAQLVDDLSGTKVNTMIQDGKLLANVC